MANATNASQARMVREHGAIYVVTPAGRRLLAVQLVNAGHPAAATAHARVLAALEGETGSEGKAPKRKPPGVTFL